MKRSLGIAAVVVVFLTGILAASVTAQGPGTAPPQGGISASGDSISFQGRLYDSTNAPLINATVNMRFSVCSDSACATVVWGPTEVASVQTDAGGYFTILLGGSGTGAAFNADHFTADRYLRVEVCTTLAQNPCASGWDDMLPHRPLTSVAIAVGNIRKNLPDTSTANTSGFVLQITNSGSGNGLRGDGWYGLYGYSATGGWGVYGGGGNGVWGVQGNSPDSYGVYGTSGSGFGVYGYSSTGWGVRGEATSTTSDVYGVVGMAGGGTLYLPPALVSAGTVGSVNASGDYGVFGLNTAAVNAYGVVGAASGTTINLPPAGTGAGVVGSMGIANDYGVWGYNSATGGGWGVWGGSAGTTGGAAGVMGMNTFAAGAGQSAIGVVGVAGTGSWTYLTGSAVGVLGSVARATDYGVFGYNSATTGGTGVQGQGFTGVVGYSAYARGVFGQTAVTTSGTGQAVLGYASATAANVHGVYGVAGTGTWSVPSAPAGVAGYVNATNGIGVWGGNGDTTGGYGVYGSGYYGVYGASSYYAGVYGNSSYTYGYGVYGYSSGTAGAGVYGRETANGYPNTYGVAGHHSGGGVGVGAWSFSGNIFEGYSGDYPNTATRRLHLTNAGELYVDVGYYTPSAMGGDEDNVLAAMLVPENLAEDFGTASLVNGQATVQIASDFAAVVNLTTDYHVFLTPRGDCRGLYVAATGPTHFEVRELGGGKSNILFDYRIVAKRQGLENLRMQPVPEVAPSGKVAPAEPPPTIGVTTAAGAGLPAVAPATVTVQQAPPNAQQTRPAQAPAAPANRPK